jgi:hypothetical protein
MLQKKERPGTFKQSNEQKMRKNVLRENEKKKNLTIP